MLQRRRPSLCLLHHICPICMRDWESGNHIMIHCSFAGSIWANFLRWPPLSWTMPCSFLDLVRQWNYPPCKGKKLWVGFMHGICWGNFPCEQDMVGYWFLFRGTGKLNMILLFGASGCLGREPGKVSPILTVLIFRDITLHMSSSLEEHWLWYTNLSNFVLLPVMRTTAFSHFVPDRCSFWFFEGTENRFSQPGWAFPI